MERLRKLVKANPKPVSRLGQTLRGSARVVSSSFVSIPGPIAATYALRVWQSGLGERCDLWETVVIEARIQIVGDESDWFAGACKLPVLPPIGGRIRAMDRNSNYQTLRVVDVMVEAASIILDSETPGGLGIEDNKLRIEIICSDLP